MAFIFLWVYLFIRITTGSMYIQEKGLFPIMRTSFINRMLTIPTIILFYLNKFFFPKNLAIARHWVVELPNFYNFFLPATVILILIFFMVFFIFKTKNKKFLFFFIWFFVGLFPHIQIVPLNMTAAERWFYFPIVGLLGMIGATISQQYHYIDKKPVMKKIMGLTMVFIIILFSIRVIIRTFDWRNGLTLFSHDIKFSKHTFDLENNLGAELVRVGKIKQAKIHLEKSVQMAPQWWINWNNLGVVYEREGDFNKAETYLKKSISNGDYSLAYENYTAILIKQGKNNKAKSFLEKKALIKFPQNIILQKQYKHLLEEKQKSLD